MCLWYNYYMEVNFILVSNNDNIKRISLRVDTDLLDKIKHFSYKEGISSNQWIEDAINHYINWINDDYDVPTASVQRINQILDLLAQNGELLKINQQYMKTGFKTIISSVSDKGYLEDLSDDDTDFNNSGGLV